MDYLDYELQQQQYYEDSTCEECGECVLEEYYACTCEEEE